MGLVSVKYNNETLSPTPTVSRSYQFLDYGNRFGQIEQIELNSFITGYSSPQNAISTLNSKFGHQFKTLEVLDDAVSIYKWDNAILQEVSIPNNAYHPGGFIPYNAKFISYQVPSGVIDPVNEYSFNQGTDGTVTVNHKISAKGIKGTNGALDNAISFVKSFVRKNPYDSCAPTFFPNNTGILFNVSESVDRTACTYAVTEIYKYTTGVAGYLRTDSLSIDESKFSDYPTIDLSIKLQGSPVDNNLSAVRASALKISPESVLQEYGLVTTGLFRNSFTIAEDSGSTTIELKTSFFSGHNTDYSGFFDYGISYDEDLLTNLQSWRIEGEYAVKGPVSFKNTRISAFKTANEGTDGFNTYLSGLILTSKLYNTFCGHSLVLNNLNISENTGLGLFRLNASYSDYDTASGLVNPKYSIDVEPSKWHYELIPAANIEGHYVIQDLQMKTAAKARISLVTDTTGTKSEDIRVISGIVDTLSGIYLGFAFLTERSFSSGVNSCEISNSFIGEELQGKEFLDTKVYGSFNNNYTRRRGFQFGY